VVTATEPEHVPGAEKSELVRVRGGSLTTEPAMAEVRA
jgi:hypothetical protein